MNDQEPAALINGQVFTRLTPKKVKELVAMMKRGKRVADMVKTTGDGAKRLAADEIHGLQ